MKMVRGFVYLLAAFAVCVLALQGCAPLPPEREEVTVADCEERRVQCVLCVDTRTGDGDWYYQIAACPDGRLRIDFHK
jgi:hypothetical protein